ncbi:MAG: hypothetical protein AAGM38_02185 [Pseudomonadota bacterium]
MPHDHPSHPHPAGHNGPSDPAHHLHSHMTPEDEAAELQALSAQFIEGFAAASDKAAFLRIAGVPLEIESETGGAKLKLVDVSVTSQWQVGAASPAFGSAELAYLPYPGEMIRERTNCALTYVSLTERRDMDLRAFLSAGRAGA